MAYEGSIRAFCREKGISESGANWNRHFRTWHDEREKFRTEAYRMVESDIKNKLSEGLLSIADTVTAVAKRAKTISDGQLGLRQLSELVQISKTAVETAHALAGRSTNAKDAAINLGINVHASVVREIEQKGETYEVIDVDPGQAQG